MIKVICFMRRKPGLSMAEFKAYYEEKHVPLILRLMPPHVEYRRNFIADRPHDTGHLVQDSSQDAGFDVLTELTYADDAMYQMTLDALADPDIGAIIREDEEKFFDRASMRAFLVDERRSIA